MSYQYAIKQFEGRDIRKNTRGQSPCDVRRKTE